MANRSYPHALLLGAQNEQAIFHDWFMYREKIKWKLHTAEK